MSIELDHRARHASSAPGGPSASGRDAGKDKSSRRHDRHGAERVIERNVASHLIARRLTGVALVSLLAAAVSVVCAFGIIGRPVPPQYLPVTAAGEILPMPPIDKPNMDKGAVGAFALEAIHAIYTYDYINWNDQLNSASTYFSPRGWDQFQKEYMANHTLDAVKSRKMIVSVKPTGEVTIKDGVGNGVWLWVVSVPITVTYTAHTTTASGAVDPGNVQSGTLSLYLSRVPITINPRGIAIQMVRFKLDKNTAGQ